MGSSDQQFCLRWNNHQTNLLSVFDQLLQNESFVDVTLACDGLSLKAHKVVLSACSPYFQSLLLENPCQHPIVILKDVGYPDLKALVDFMYKGEVNVSQEQLAALLKTAEMLKVKGLSEVSPNRPLSPHRKDGGQVRVTVCASAVSPPRLSASSPSPSPPGKRKKGWPRKRSGGGGGSSGQEDAAEDNGAGAGADSPAEEVVDTKVARMRGGDGQSSSAAQQLHSGTPLGQVEEKHEQCLESSNVLAMPGFASVMSHGPAQQQQQQQQQQHEYHQPPPAAAAAVSTHTHTHTPPAAWSRRRRSPVLDGPLRCGICAKVISSACNFRKHMEVHNPVRQFYPCPLCQRGYNRKDNLSWHLKHKHGVPTTQRRPPQANRTSSSALADEDEDGHGHRVPPYS